MNAADLHAQALARIAERWGLVERASDLPWSLGEVEGPFPEERIPAYVDIEPLVGGGINVPDAAVIVQMSRDYGPLLDLAEDVLLRHAPHMLGMWDNGCDDACTGGWPCRDAAAALRSIGLVTT